MTSLIDHEPESNSALEMAPHQILGMTTDIIHAYVQHNPMKMDEIAGLVTKIGGALRDLDASIRAG